MISQYLHFIIFTKIMEYIPDIQCIPTIFYDTIDDMSIHANNFITLLSQITHFPFSLVILMFTPIFYLFYLMYKVALIPARVQSRSFATKIIQDFTRIQNICLMGLDHYIVFNILVDPLHTLSAARQAIIDNIYPINMILDIALIIPFSIIYKHIKLSKMRVAHILLSNVLFYLAMYQPNDLVHSCMLMYFISDFLVRVCRIFKLRNVIIAWRNYMYPGILLFLVYLRQPSIDYAAITLYIIMLVFLNAIELVRNSNILRDHARLNIDYDEVGLILSQ